MGAEHLNGKRTGRHRASKSAPPWERDVRWAYRNVADPDAQPPLALAGLLAALGRQHPDRLFLCLALLEAPREPAPSAESRKAGASQQPPEDSAAVKKPPKRVRKLFLTGSFLFNRLKSNDSFHVSGLPDHGKVVGCEVDPSREGLVLILHSGEFSPVAEGGAIPELTTEYDREFEGLR
jgi:hypothetical protein